MPENNYAEEEIEEVVDQRLKDRRRKRFLAVGLLVLMISVPAAADIVINHDGRFVFSDVTEVIVEEGIELDMGGDTINNVEDPELDHQAATRGWVLDQLEDIEPGSGGDVVAWSYEMDGEINDIEDSGEYVYSIANNLHKVDYNGNRERMDEVSWEGVGVELMDNGDVLVATRGNKLKRLDERGNELWSEEFELNGYLQDLVYSDSGEVFLLTGESIYEVDLNGRRVLWSENVRAPIQGSMDIGPNGDLFYANEDDEILMLDVSCKRDETASGCSEVVYKEHYNAVRPVVTDSEGNIYSGGSGSGQIHKHDKGGSQHWIYRMDDGSGPSNVLSISISGEKMFSGSTNNHLHEVDIDCLDKGGSSDECRQREISLSGSGVSLEASRGEGSVYVGEYSDGNSSLKLVN